MSAMLESFDMPMHDYQNDLDIQMHPSSDQWFPDEAQMEEDGPGGSMKPENYSPPKGDNSSQMKTDAYSQEKAEITIEVDMEPFLEHHNGAEYDMEADEDIHHTGGENLDVEVYDVSVAQSPLMIAGEIVQDGPSNFVGSFDHTESATLSHNTSPLIPHTSDLAPLESETHGNSSLHDVRLGNHDFQLDSVSEVQAPAVNSDPIVEQDNAVSSSETFLDPHIPEEPAPDIPLPTEPTHIPELPDTVTVASVVQEEASEDYIKAPTLDDHVDIETTAIENALGDPHEISEGVYIDPPPPVLLSVGSEDHFDCSLFNESPISNTSDRQSDGQTHQAGLVLLHHFPTLYYEPLSAVFDALRLEEYIQSMFHLPESELIMDAVDLQLTLREDNVYAREVSLHDLNVLHDVSGIHGQLRMRLSASTPRFLTRYQYLQEHVSQLNLEPSSDIPLAGSAQNNNLEEAPVEENQEAQVDENPIEEHAENHAKDHPEEPNQSEDKQDNAHEQGNQDDGRAEIEPQAHTTEFFNPETDLPPLPAEDDDEDGEADEQTSSMPNDFDGSLSVGGSLDMSQQPPGPETEVEQPHENTNAIIPLEILDAPDADSHVSSEGEHGARRSEGEEGEPVVEKVDGEGGEDDPVVAGEGEHDDVVDYRTIGDQESGHQGDYLEGGYGEHDYQEHGEDEYAEDEPAADDQGGEYYQEGDTIHYAEDHLDYVEGEEANATLDTQSPDAPLAELSEFDNVHPNTDESVTDELFVGPGSLLEQFSTDETVDGDVVHISQPDTSEQECDPSETDPTYQTGAKPETETEITSFGAGQQKQSENGPELEQEADLESTVDPNMEETYSWEDDFDGDGDPETPLEGDNENAPSHSNHSSVTLSSKASKRSFDDFEFEEVYEDDEGHWSPPSSPDPKRTRTH